MTQSQKKIKRIICGVISVLIPTSVVLLFVYGPSGFIFSLLAAIYMTAAFFGFIFSLMGIFDKTFEGIEMEYFPKRGHWLINDSGNYLRRDYKTGFIETTGNQFMADSFRSKEDALDFIEEYIQQDYKKDVISINIK